MHRVWAQFKNDGSSNSENLLEASIYRVSAKLAVRDKFEILLYFSSSSTFVFVWSSRSIKCALIALVWNVLSELICRVAYPLLQCATCTLLDIHWYLCRERVRNVLLYSDTVGERAFWWRYQVDVEVLDRWRKCLETCFLPFVPASSDDWNL